jgi:iron complex outermembrane recepter protein
MKFRSVILGVALLATAFSSQTTHAQSATDDGDIEEIVVRGVYRGSLLGAIDDKRHNANIVDVLKAEDIGKFPDLTTADAMQRVPGVQVSRGVGETSGVLIRGLPNVKTTINGRALFSPGGRLFSYQDLPAEALSGVAVYKSRSADHVEGGIAGLVDLQTRKPLELDGAHFAGTLRLVENEHASELDPVANVLLSNSWDTSGGRFGALLNVTKIEQHYQQSNTFNAETLLSSNTPDGSTVGVPLSVGVVSDKGFRERWQANSSLQWQPSEDFELYLDSLYTTLDDELHTIFGIVFTAFEPLSDIVMNPDQSLCVDNAGTPACYVQSATVTGTGFLAGTHAKTSTVDIAQNVLGGRWTIGERATLQSELSYTDMDRTFENFIQDWWVTGGVTASFETNVADHTNFDIVGDPQLDPANFHSSGLFQPWDEQDGSEVAWTADYELELDLGVLTMFQAGVRYAAREAEFRGGDLASFAGDGLRESDYAEDYLQPVDLGGATYLDMPGFFAADYQYMLGHKEEIRAIYGLDTDRPPFNPLNRFFDAEEDTMAGYVQAAYSTEIGGKTATGLVGTRVVDIQRDMHSFGEVDGEVVPVTSDVSDTVFLPNASFNLQLNDDWLLRSAVSKTISYPEFADLNPNEFLFPPAPGTPAGSGNGGNPNLKPIESISYDVSLEYYIPDGGLASVAYFYRDIDGFITNVTETEVIDGTPYNVLRPRSSGEGTLKGFELAYTQFFTFLPAPWDGFGVQLNFTNIDGEISLADGQGGVMTTPPPGVAENNGNAVLLYDGDKLFARLAYNYRDDYIESFFAPGVQEPKSSNVRSAGRLDATVGYRFTESFTITLDGANLNDEKFYNYWGHPGRARDRRDPGRTVSLYASYTFQ